MAVAAREQFLLNLQISIKMTKNMKRKPNAFAIISLICPFISGLCLGLATLYAPLVFAAIFPSIIGIVFGAISLKRGAVAIIGFILSIIMFFVSGYFAFLIYVILGIANSLNSSTAALVLFKINL